MIFALSIYLTKDKYNVFLIANVIGLSTTFLLPAVADIIGMDIIKSAIGISFNIVSYTSLFVFYLAGRYYEGNPPPVSYTYAKISFFKNLYRFSLATNLVFIMYMVAVYGFSGAFINSRFVVYTESRVGTGHIFYIAGTFFNIYALVGLFYNKRKWLHILSCIVFALPYGSKTKMITVFIYLFVYIFMVDENRAKYRRNRYLAIIAVVVPLIVFALFWITTFDLDSVQILQLALGFGNEYQTNFNELILHFHVHFKEGYQHGRILLEEAFYPFIPRALWPGKPLYFGSLFISYKVYPEVTELNLGAPSFGPFGQAYVDFGLFGLLQIVFQQAILGFFMGKYEVQVQQRKDVRAFILLICVAFGGIFGLGGATNPLVMMVMNLIFAKCLIFASRIVLRKYQPQL
ncbi:hypothetical protein [Mucilaginibacter psychrotolerans]|nr:hypothetical protein [Mucilaginibacter psychrotolerans]